MVIFHRYHDVAPLDYIFHGILTKTKNKEDVNAADTALLKEFVKYLDKPEQVENATRFFKGFHPKDPAKQCFFAVNPDGSKIVIIIEKYFLILLAFLF